MSKKIRRSGLGGLALVGLGVGLGMLFSPKKGEELRKDLKVKIDDLIQKAKEIDVKEASEEFTNKIKEIKNGLEDLDKEKALAIAKEKGEALKKKTNELLELAKEKGTPLLEKTVSEVKVKTIALTKEVLKKLESSETSEKKKDKEEKI